MSPTTAAAIQRPESRAVDRLAGFVLFWLHRVGRHRAACVVFLFVLCAGLRVAMLHRIPPPLPEIHDEFVNLLGADTFASGRITNPPHPLRRFFETTHELSQPP